MNRIEESFNKLKNNGKKAFIPYICAGDPSLEETEKIIYTLENAGATVIQLGIPFSDPLADSSVIQEASIRSLKNGFKIKKFFEFVKTVRKKSNIPLVAMVYYSSIYGFGKEEFIKLCEESGIDGILVPDLPFEELDEIDYILEKTNICLIPTITALSKDRISKIVKKAKGYIYCVSSLGTSKKIKTFDEKIDSYVLEVKKHTELPTCVGFGISTREAVESFYKIADGVIVGSAIVKYISENISDLKKVEDFVAQLKGEK